MRYSSTISGKNKQPISEKRIRFRERDIVLASLPDFTLPGDSDFARAVIVPEGSVIPAGTVEVAAKDSDSVSTRIY